MWYFGLQCNINSPLWKIGKKELNGKYKDGSYDDWEDEDDEDGDEPGEGGGRVP